MKKLFTIIALAAFLGFESFAQPTSVSTNTLNPTTLAGTPAMFVTNYSTPVIVGYLAYSGNPQFVVNQNGLNTTNSFTNYTQFSLSTNVATGLNVTTNTFAATNAASLTPTLPTSQTVPIYGWTQTIVTNSTLVWQSVLKTTQ